jgi:uncharacterized membrane protein YphA (DoxX/SURF4 family)
VKILRPVPSADYTTMNINHDPKTQKNITAPEVEYLLKELEIQVGIESKARDRVEQMVNYFLTTIAAIIGAVLIVTELKSDALSVVFLAALLVFVFSIFVFYRFLRLRRIITHTKLNRYLIRKQLIESGLDQALFLIEIEGEPTGFSDRMVRNLKGLVFICGLSGALVMTLGIAMASSYLDKISAVSGNQSLNFIFAAIVGFGITIIPLSVILKNYREYAEELMRKKLNGGESE